MRHKRVDEHASAGGPLQGHLDLAPIESEEDYVNGAACRVDPLQQRRGPRAGLN
jgi:hypothetical protein